MLYLSIDRLLQLARLARFFDQFLIFDGGCVLEIKDLVLFVPLLLIDQALDAQKLKLVRTECLNFFPMRLADADWAIMQALPLIILLRRFEVVLTIKSPSASGMIRRVAALKDAMNFVRRAIFQCRLVILQLMCLPVVCLGLHRCLLLHVSIIDHQHRIMALRSFSKLPAHRRKTQEGLVQWELRQVTCYVKLDLAFRTVCNLNLLLLLLSGGTARVLLSASPGEHYGGRGRETLSDLHCGRLRRSAVLEAELLHIHFDLVLILIDR